MCKRIQMDGPGKLRLVGDQVYVDSSSGGDPVLEAYRIEDAMVMVSDFLNQLSERDGRPAQILAFQKKAVG